MPAIPQWQTSALPNALGGVAYLNPDTSPVTLVATSTQGGVTLTYSIASGSLPPAQGGGNLVLNSATGVISGIAANPTYNPAQLTTTYSFTVNVTDGFYNIAEPLQITLVSNYPTWGSAGGSLGTFSAGQQIT